MKRVYLSLGSNLGDRRRNIENALALLKSSRLRILRQSSWYETEPVGITSQPWFLNIAVEAETSLLPMMLLRRALGVERQMGRRRTVRNAPRIIDIDILLYAQFEIATALLTVPHPRMAERRFVMEPMAELAPDLAHPALKRPMREILASIRGQAVKRFVDVE